MSKPAKKAAEPEAPQQINPEDYNQLEVTFTDMEVQFIAKELLRKDAIIQRVNHMYAESLQHFAVMVAKKKNIQFPENLFVGVHFDTKKQKAYILLNKEEPKATSAVEPGRKDPAAQSRRPAAD